MTKPPISRQRAGQIRHAKRGLCIKCGSRAARQRRDPNKYAPYCQIHRDSEAVRQRNRRASLAQV